MRKFLQKILTKPIVWLANKYGSKPDKDRICSSLSALRTSILTEPGKKGLIRNFQQTDKIIIFSDQHKGARNLADDFAMAEKNYLAALAYYHSKAFTFVNLGDSEELWENLMIDVKKHNKAAFEAERLFIKDDKFIKIFGNHDLYWDNDPLAGYYLERIYKTPVKIWEGLILQTIIDGEHLDIFLTHGHQGDLQSDGNWFSKWFISTIWAPLQSYLMINLNTPAYDNELKCIHNQLMYEWSATQDNMLLITGHTHQPVFNSLTFLERIYMRLEQAIENNQTKVVEELKQLLQDRLQLGETIPTFKAYKPNYFNTGCCCYSDGDITGIEIEDGKIRLIKWKYALDGTPERSILEEETLANLLKSHY